MGSHSLSVKEEMQQGSSCGKQKKKVELVSWIFPFSWFSSSPSLLGNPNLDCATNPSPAFSNGLLPLLFLKPRLLSRVLRKCSFFWFARAQGSAATLPQWKCIPAPLLLRNSPLFSSSDHQLVEGSSKEFWLSSILI